MNQETLPSHLDQSPEVRARFERIRNREVILEVRGLGKRYRTPQGDTEALKGIDFSVRRREFVCVIGPSGCGKSTLIRILAGLDQHTDGEALLDGKPIKGPGQDRGMVFQGYSLFPWLTVKKNVMFGPQMNGRGRDEAEHDAMMWLDLVGLEKFADAYPHQLSGGMRQRVAIARALVNQPRILLMDEPFGALDAQTRARMQTHLIDIWKNIDITVLFITHDLDEAIYLADRILVLKAHPGEVQEVIEVPVPRPRTPGQFNSPEFRATKARLEELIHPAAEHAPEDEEDDKVKPHLIRLTDINDNVE
ncbi:ABC transporter ATP-binding protein [Parasulfuritortus cantonensis]|uniref:ABC transporter ATP-binding protein n=1 Tax=Parasulfuritortus cantonensis TaxID=2528202 RepID=A0A4V2NVV8_9PROT|nr:ABC transporter ATP-binding protein [Parasulfuritortus cantonensis]TCJ14952.1 ABC transporter ATP-binding protein [Parasulfuritortus cantonensis]